MTINLLTGIPGSGKSYDAIKRFMIPALKEGRVVYHNIRGPNTPKCLMNISLYLDKDYDEIKELLRELPTIENNGIVQTDPYFYDKIEKDSLIILDEVQNIYNARQWQNNTHAVQFFTTHRHYGHDILLITQDSKLCDSTIRRLTDTLWTYRKSSHLGSSKRYIYRTYLGCEPDKSQMIDEQLAVKYDKDIFPLYQSHDGEVRNEKVFTKNIFTTRKMIIVYISIIVLVASLFRACTSSQLLNPKTSFKGKTENEIFKVPRKDPSKPVKMGIDKGSNAVFYTQITADEQKYYLVTESKKIIEIDKKHNLNQSIIKIDSVYYMPLYKTDKGGILE